MWTTHAALLGRAPHQPLKMFFATFFSLLFIWLNSIREVTCDFLTSVSAPFCGPGTVGRGASAWYGCSCASISAGTRHVCTRGNQAQARTRLEQSECSPVGGLGGVGTIVLRHSTEQLGQVWVCWKVHPKPLTLYFHASRLNHSDRPSCKILFLLWGAIARKCSLPWKLLVERHDV